MHKSMKQRKERNEKKKIKRNSRKIIIKIYLIY